ncbi:hypothetical protein SAMN05660226_03947 [Parapedobacter luteus]|uniref:Uncharacterized protein n=1 Tax=Parapedobacter luteus TaxID=623280 RepID=A0A1T5FEJ5_9SPHI|nr:hypothetical protein SAMN05660226_03947 [Parapedobacter luteus]
MNDYYYPKKRIPLRIYISDIVSQAHKLLVCGTIRLFPSLNRDPAHNTSSYLILKVD